MHRISRRGFLRQSAGLVVGVMAAACSTPAPVAPTDVPSTEATEVPAEVEATAIPEEVPTAEEEATEAPTVAPAESEAMYHEAPMLAERVAAGELPPVEERLPDVPKLANEMPSSWLEYEIGTYGGTMHTATALADRCPDATVSMREPLVNTPGIIADAFTPNLVEDFEVSADQQEFTFRLRTGLKWSDGEPVTMEDLRFTIEDVVFNPEITSSIPTWLRVGNKAGNEPFQFEVVDDVTFKFVFSEPYGGFLTALSIAGWRDYADILKPAHYLKPFHQDYADPDELEAAVAEAGLETWVQLFTNVDVLATQLGYQKAIGFPMLRAWILKETGTERFVFERNPYYHKVDAEGNQLPYMDNWVVILAQDIETVAMMHIAGEVGFARESASLAKLPLYKENEQASGIRVLLNRLHVTSTDVMLNLTYDDPVWREVVRNKKFREALNYAIDRDEIIEGVYYGFAELPSWFPHEFDVDKANALLDEIGMDRRDGEGFRLGPDGQTFVIPIETGAHVPDMVPVCELFVQFWTDVGIKTTLKRVDQALWGQRNGANELQCGTLWTPGQFYQLSRSQAVWGPLWSRWHVTAGKEGEEPPDEVKELLNNIDALLVVPPADVPGLIEELDKNVAENVYYFAVGDNFLQPMIVSANLGNVDASEEAWAIAVNFSGEQFFFRD